FRVVDASGQVMYTRNGEFSVNKEGYLVNPQGHFLTRYDGESTPPERIRVPYGNIAPKATEGTTMAANFNANAPLNETLGVLYEDPATAGDDPIPHYFRMDGGNYVWVDAAGNPAPAPAGAGGTIVSNGVTVTFDGTGQPDDVTGTEFTAYTPRPDFDPAVAGSYTHSLPITVYDSLGNSHQLVQYFVKQPPVGGESVWDVYYRMDGQPLTSPADGATQMRFDSAGRLMSPTGP